MAGLCTSAAIRPSGHTPGPEPGVASYQPTPSGAGQPSSKPMTPSQPFTLLQPPPLPPLTMMIFAVRFGSMLTWVQELISQVAFSGEVLVLLPICQRGVAPIGGVQLLSPIASQSAPQFT